METVLTFTFEHAHSAYWIFFLLIMAAGLNIPISEDIIMISAGALAAVTIPEQTQFLFLWLFIACWISAWEAYWIGRLIGPKLYRIKWFTHILNPQRVERLHYHYEKYGLLTFMIIRFIPGGVRNAFFMTSGLGKMPFHMFILRDFPACLASAVFLYVLGYSFGKNHQVIIDYFHTYDTTIFAVILVFILTFFIAKFIPRRSRIEG